jgi:hypothetical protein
LSGYHAGKGTPVDSWDFYIDEPNQLPALLEVDPGQYVKIAEATPAQLRDAATRLEKNAKALRSLAKKYRMLARGDIQVN